MSVGHITVPSLPEVALPGRAVATPRSTVSPGQCTGTAAETMNVTFDKRITEDDGQHRNIGQPTDFPTGHEGNADLLGEKYNRKSESEPVSLPSSTQMPDQSISLNTTAKLNGASEKLKVHHRRHISLPPDILQYKPEAPSQESENPVEQHVENECANASLLHVNSNRAHHLQLIYHMLRHAESVYGLPLTVTSAPAISLSKLTDRGIICKRTGITQNNILMAEFSSQPFCPAFYVAVDTAARAIVICVRGTAKFSDSLTDVAATHDPVCVRMRSNQYGDRIKRRQSQYSYRRASTPLRTRPNSSQSSISSSSLSSTSLGKLSPASSGSALGSGTGFGRVAGSTPDPSLTDETAGEPLSHPSNNLSKNVTISSTNDNGTFIENHPNDVKADSDDYIEGFGHAGIVQSARNLVQKVRDCVTKTLSQEEYQGYAVITTGHSLGAGTASVLALILREEIKLGAEETPIFCVAFAPPPCLTYEVADAANKCTLTVVNGPDVVPRLSVAMLVPLFATARYVADLPRHKKSLVGLGLKGVAVDWDELYNLTIERMGHLDRLHDGRRLFLPGRVLHITRTRKKRWRVRKVDQGAEEEKPSKINKRADVDSDPTDNNFDDSFGNDGDEEDTNDDDEMMEEGLRDNGNGRVRDEEMKRFIFTWLSRKRVENKERDRKSPSIFSRKWRPNYVACVSREPRTKFLNIKRREKGMFLAHAPFSYRAVLSQALRNFDESPVPAHGIGQVMTRLMSQDMSSADVWTELCNQGWPEVC